MDVKPPATVDAGVVLPTGARIRGRAHITSADQVLVMGPSRHDGVTMCTAHVDPDIGVRIVRGCYSGTIDGFEDTARQYAATRPDQLAQAYEYADAAREHFGVTK